MQKTVCELFAGVGGFRCGLNSIKNKDFSLSSETWKTVWFNQWEPGKKNQWAHDCYVKHFGTALDLNGKDTTNIDISAVDKTAVFHVRIIRSQEALTEKKELKGKKAFFGGQSGIF